MSVQKIADVCVRCVLCCRDQQTQKTFIRIGRDRERSECAGQGGAWALTASRVKSACVDRRRMVGGAGGCSPSSAAIVCETMMSLGLGRGVGRTET
jgi:hypothetical protein